MKTILIIEDEKSLRKEVAEILTFEDFNVIEAENGLLGLNKAIET
jgi:DNA-binding response OmpR family regulator